MLRNRLKHHINCASCKVNHLCLMKDLEDSTITELNSIISTVKYFGKGEHVFHAQETMNCLYAVHSGSCKDYAIDENGNERIDNFYLSGDIIGLESIPQRKFIFSLVALEETELCVLPLDELIDFMQKNDSLLKRIFNITSFKMQNNQFISRSTNTQQRVASFILNMILRLEERNDFHGSINLPMSQLDISNYLGMTHETVNRVMRKFHKDKIINIKNKTIYILNLDHLKELSSPIIHFGQI